MAIRMEGNTGNNCRKMWGLSKCGTTFRGLRWREVSFTSRPPRESASDIHWLGSWLSHVCGLQMAA